MLTPSPAPIIIQQPVGVNSWPAPAMQRQDPFKNVAAPIGEKHVMETRAQSSTDAPSTSGVKQLVRSFEDREQTGVDDSYILNNPHMFEPRVLDELSERLGIEFPAGKRRRGKEEKAVYIKQELAKRRGKGKAPM
jgi:hypothetical protein